MDTRAPAEAAPQPDIDPPCLIEAVKILQNSFMPGDKIYEKMRVEKLASPENFLHFSASFSKKCDKDPNYRRDCNLIAGTNFVASAGPMRDTSANELGHLIADTICHPKPEHRIERIVALGYLGRDFMNYSQQMGNPGLFLGDNAVTKVITRDVKKTPFNHKRDNVLQIKLGVTKSNVQHSEQTLHVTVIELRDGHSIRVDKDVDNVLKQKLWELFNISRQQKVLVHCFAGLGRTGCFIAMHEILGLFLNAAEAPRLLNPIYLAVKCSEIVANMRQHRPAMILNFNQLKFALISVYDVYQYAVKIGHIQKNIFALPTAAPSPDPKLVAPASTQAAMLDFFSKHPPEPDVEGVIARLNQAKLEGSLPATESDAAVLARFNKVRAEGELATETISARFDQLQLDRSLHEELEGPLTPSP